MQEPRKSLIAQRLDERLIGFPRLSEPRTALTLAYCAPGDPGRAALKDFVLRVFRDTYAADIDAFCPELLSLSRPDGELCAVTGLRAAAVEPLYSEYYLDHEIARLLSRREGVRIDRAAVVEVGNLAPADVGQARWLIATLTAYLYCAGFRWVVFTAVPVIFNAFGRMGLPLHRLAAADPARLPPSARDRWGSYYQEQPVVCYGDIHAGYRMLRARIEPERENLWALWQQACLAGEMRARGARAAGLP